MNSSSELSFGGLLLAIILTIVLASSSTFLALKVGILPSASIPAAILAMGILRIFKKNNILENNLVQTAASAGEAVAGGIVYTIPALVIIRYWTHFSYWQNVAIALGGGLLGVVFSIPLRKPLVHDKKLAFPEGRAIAEVLNMDPQQRKSSFRHLVMGSLLGSLIEFLQTGLQVVASGMQYWFKAGATVAGFGMGFSATLIGAGYLMGFSIGLSLALGAVINWIIGVPVLAYGMQLPDQSDAIVMHLWDAKLHYLGIGAMLTAGIFTLITLLKPFYESFIKTTRSLSFSLNQKLPATEQDIPLPFLMIALACLFTFLFFLCQHLFELHHFAFSQQETFIFLLISLFYILIIGFIFCTICGYFSGMVGVTASPGSAIVIAGLLLAALFLRIYLQHHDFAFSQDNLKQLCAIVIIIGSIITGAACIANDNIQDLKVGQLIGSTPWKQQLMLVLGTIVAALIIPIVMQLLFSVYGLVDVLPHANMDPARSLAAPPAAMMATLTQAVFNQQIPWPMLNWGVGIMLVIIFLNYVLFKNKLSILGVGMGMYLPMTSSMPLFLGSLFFYFFQKRSESVKSKGMLRACGLVSGAALMDVLLAIPMGISGSPNVLSIMPIQMHQLSVILGIISVLILGAWLQRK